MKDWCTSFPDIYKGRYIGDCCKEHDKTCSTHSFFKCLKAKIGLFHAFYIAIGGGIGCWTRHTKLMIKRWKK